MRLSVPLALLLLLAFAAPPPAVAATPAKTDVALLFDTTGSMDDALAEASEQAQEVVTRLRASLPDVRIAVADLRDYEAYGDSGDYPFRLVQPATGDATAVDDAIDSLYAAGGGDGPESYGRALQELDVNPEMGWRPDARRVAVLVADNVPHDDDLNEGVPDDAISRGSPWDTGIDPGPDEEFETADDIDWQRTVSSLRDHGLPLMYVLYQGSASTLKYWRHWAGLTGGQAIDASDVDTGSLADAVVAAAEAGAKSTLPPCPEGQDRDSSGRCRSMPVIFLPGIMGSEIWCAGERKLWFNYRAGTGINHKEMLLAADGVSPRNPKNECNRTAGSRDGYILRNAEIFGAHGVEAYGTTVDTLKARYGDAYSTFTYDWRKTPSRAVAALDAHINGVRAQHGGVRVRLAAHSMGGLVVREYLGDPARAAKVRRAATVGTPYWGSPASFLPIARGDSSTAWFNGLDAILGNDELKDLASTMAGLYSLMPSDSWYQVAGSWLDMQTGGKRQQPKTAAATAKAMNGKWSSTTESLYNEATALHQRIDGFQTNGTQFMAIVGSGLSTVGGWKYIDRPLAKDTYDPFFTNGDATVPLISAAQGDPAGAPKGEAVARRYACRVKHDEEPGNAQVQARCSRS